MPSLPKTYGYIAIVLSLVTWLLAASMFFWTIPHRATIGLILYVFSYVFWFLASWILGQDTIAKWFSKKKSVKEEAADDPTGTELNI